MHTSHTSYAGVLFKTSVCRCDETCVRSQPACQLHALSNVCALDLAGVYKIVRDYICIGKLVVGWCEFEYQVHSLQVVDRLISQPAGFQVAMYTETVMISEQSARSYTTT